MTSKGVSLLKFVGTISLGLLTGVSYTVSTYTLPTFLQLPSSSHASYLLTNLTSDLRIHNLALSVLSTVPFVLSYILSPRSARHPYLLYTSLLAALSISAPSIAARITPPTIPPPQQQPQQQQQSSKKTVVKPPVRTLEASYELLGDDHSDEAVSEAEEPEQQQQEQEPDDLNGEDVRADVEVLAKGYNARAGIAALGFAVAVLGLWGDGSPQAIVYVS